MPEPKLRRWVRLLGATALLAVVLLFAIALGSAALANTGSTPDSTPTPATSESADATTGSQGPNEKDEDLDDDVVALACTTAAREVRQGDLDAARAVLTSAGVTADNYESELADEPTCLSAWVLTTPDPPPASSVWETAGKAWDEFVKATFTPLASVMTFIIGGWLAIFVLARLMVELPLIRHVTSDRDSRRTLAWMGWSLLALVPVGGAIVGIHTTGLVQVFAAALLVVLAVVAAVSIALWLATLRVLRIDVTADTADGDGKFVSTALVTAQLRDLSSASGAIDLPTGPLVKDLADSLKDFSSVAWVAAVQKIVLFLIGVTPWVATVVVRSGTAATVTVVRNRATVATKRVSTAGPGLEPLATPPDKGAGAADFLSVMIAAEILMALREGYRMEFDPGLAGATSARSIGLQYIAITWYTTTLDTSAATTLLATATRADPDNQLARYSFAYVQNRHVTEPEQLIAFGDKLDDWISQRQHDRFGFSDQLLQAMTVTRAAAARNLAAIAMARRLQGGGALTKALRKDALRSLETARKGLDHLLASGEMDDTDEAVARRLRFGAASLTRAAMVLKSSTAPATFDPDLPASLTGALATAEERAAAARAALNAARGVRQAAERDLSRAAETGPPVSDRTSALAAVAAARRTEHRAEGTRDRRQRQVDALRAILSAQKADLFRTDASLAYSLATELVCWERQRIEGPPVAPFLGVSAHVTVLDQFSLQDPELATAEDFNEWKKRRERAARAARAAAAAAGA